MASDLAVTIRQATQADVDAVLDVYPSAFPQEDLVPLARSLLADGSVLNILAARGEGSTGHIAFSPCTVAGHPDPVGLLGPLAVHPSAQRSGIGTALIRAGLDSLKGRGHAAVYVLGDPAYYGRFGFRAERSVAPPHDIPPEWAEAWQSIHLTGADAPGPGRLEVPPVWDDPALWAP